MRKGPFRNGAAPFFHFIHRKMEKVVKYLETDGYSDQDMWLIYVDDNGERHHQHWRDISEVGNLIDEFGNDMDLIGWTTINPETGDEAL